MIRRSQQHRFTSDRGFSLIELTIVVAIGLVLMALAVPGIRSSLEYFAMRAAVSSLTGAIQSNRYQAIFHGCPYQVAFNAAAYNYQVSSEVPAVGGAGCAAAFTNVGNPIPLQGSGVTLNGNITLVFHPSGQVQTTLGNAQTILLSAATPSALTETISVSNYGRVNVAP